MNADQRAKFEAWARERGIRIDSCSEGPQDLAAHYLEIGWQACLAANGVEKLLAENEQLRQDWTAALFEAVELGTLLREAHRSVCSLECLSQWKTSEGQRHSSLCQRITAAMAKHEGKPA